MHLEMVNRTLTISHFYLGVRVATAWSVSRRRDFLATITKKTANLIFRILLARLT